MSTPTTPPERVPLRKTVNANPLPSLSPSLLQSFSLSPSDLSKTAQSALDALNTALASDDGHAVEACFYPAQTYWRDQFALTWHMRTFMGAGRVARNLMAVKRERGVRGFELVGAPMVIPASPALQWIDCGFTFKTTSPGASASGRFLLLPVDEDGTVRWKIWILSTWLEGIDIQAEDESLLREPGRELEGVEKIETEVVIIGGGNAGACLAARLKALAVDSVILERNANPGDSWALRYDSLKFHVPTSICEMPYLPYPKEFHTPNRLTRDALTAQLRRFIAEFHLNTIHSATVQSTIYNPTTKLWTVTFTTPNAPNTPNRTITAKHLVQATGFSSQKPHLPSLPNRDTYKGLTLHAHSYRNPSSSLPNATSVLLIGSANTAFDILSDLAPLPSVSTITMAVRSPTLIIPESYAFDPRGFGSFDTLPLPIADRNLNTLTTVIDAHMAGGLFAMLAAQEPGRYDKLREVGFPVRDSAHEEENVYYNLAEKGGGHYVDIGGTRVLEEGRGTVKVGEPVGWTETGLKFSDGSIVEADAVVWCTGYGDKDLRDTVEGVLGSGGGGEGEGVLGPREIAERVEPTGGVDAEGEFLGMWKRHAGVENYWVMGGHTAQHRWFSKMLAMEIKAALEGVLPEAWRETV